MNAIMFFQVLAVLMLQIDAKEVAASSSQADPHSSKEIQGAASPSSQTDAKHEMKLAAEEETHAEKSLEKAQAEMAPAYAADISALFFSRISLPALENFSMGIKFSELSQMKIKELSCTP